MCCISQARAAQEHAQGTAGGVNGIFQIKRSGLSAGGEPPTEGEHTPPPSGGHRGNVFRDSALDTST